MYSILRIDMTIEVLQIESCFSKQTLIIAGNAEYRIFPKRKGADAGETPAASFQLATTPCITVTEGSHLPAAHAYCCQSN